MPRPLGKGRERVGQRMVWREVLRARHLRQRRIHVHAYPPEKAREHADRAKNSQVAGSDGVAGVQHPSAHQHRNVDARGWYGGRRAAGPGVVGLYGCRTRRTVSSLVRRSWLLPGRASTSRRCGRWDGWNESRRLSGGGAGECKEI